MTFAYKPVYNGDDCDVTYNGVEYDLNITNPDGTKQVKKSTGDAKDTSTGSTWTHNGVLYKGWTDRTFIEYGLSIDSIELHFTNLRYNGRKLYNPNIIIDNNIDDGFPLILDFDTWKNSTSYYITDNTNVDILKMAPQTYTVKFGSKLINDLKAIFGDNSSNIIYVALYNGNTLSDDTIFSDTIDKSSYTIGENITISHNNMTEGSFKYDTVNYARIGISNTTDGSIALYSCDKFSIDPLSENVIKINYVVNEIYPDSTFGNPHTGTVDAEGLKAIGWTDEDIAYLQDNVWWDAADDAKHVATDTDKRCYANNTADIDRWCGRQETFNNIPSDCSRFFRNKGPYSCEGFPRFDTSEVVNMTEMFCGLTKLRLVPELDTRNVTNMQSMFNGCSSLTSIPRLSVSNVTDMSHMFADCKSLTDVPDLDTANVTNMQSMFTGCSSLTSVPELNVQNVTDAGAMFRNCKSLKTIQSLDMVKIKNMYAMFSGCASLENISSINISNSVSSDYTLYMFDGCASLVSISFVGVINVSINLSFSPKLSYDSVKSTLTAASKKTNNNAKTLSFNLTMTDRNGELAALVNTCTSKGWTISGLTLS